MTGTHEKLRSLILVTLMVFSVFAGTVAFTGTVAAAHNATGNDPIFDNRDNGPGSVSPLDANVTVRHVGTQSEFTNIQLNFSDSVEESGSPAFDGNFTLVKDGNVVIRVYNTTTDSLVASYRTDAVVKSKDDNNQTITVGLSSNQNPQSLNSDYSVNVTLTDNFVNPSTAGNYTNATFQFDPGSDGAEMAGHLQVLAEGAAGPGEITPQEPTYVVQNLSTYYVGQTLATDASSAGSGPFEASESVSIQREADNGSFVTVDTVTANSTGWVVYDTDDLQQATYRFQGASGVLNDGPERVYVKLVEQELSASFNPGSVNPNKDPSSTLSVTSDNRGGTAGLGPTGGSYRIHVTSANLTDEEIDAVFGVSTDSSLTDTTQGFATTISSSSGVDLSANFNVENGDYEFDVDVVDTIAHDNATVLVSDQPPQATLEQDFVEVPQGDIATYTVSMADTTSVQMVVGSNTAGYKVTATLTDGNGDGTVTVAHNTYLTGRFQNDETQAWSAVSSGDSVTANLETDELDDLVDQSEYNVILRKRGAELDIGALIVAERSTGSMNTYIAPRADLANLNSPAAIAAAKEGGSLTEASEVANGDVVVYEVDATGVFGAIAASHGDNAVVTSAGFQNVVSQGDTLAFSMAQTNPDVNQDPKILELDRSISNGAARFVADEANGTMYILVRTGTTNGSDAHFYRTSPTRQDVFHTEAGDNYLTEFTVVGGSLLAASDETANSTTSILEPSLTFDVNHEGDIILWKPDNTDITGQTNLAPGTDFSVRIRSSEGAGFIKSNGTTVAADGTFTVPYTFPDTEPTKNFTAVTQAAPVSVSGTGALIERPTATVTLNDQTVAAADEVQTVTVASVSMNYGGFVTIHDASLADGDAFGSVAGTSSYLGPGSHSDVSVRLGVKNLQSSQQVFAMPHRDTDDDGTYDFVGSEGADDGPYTEASSGDPVVSAAQITVSTPTPTPTATPTPDTGGTPTATATPTATDTPTSGDGPGFGLVAAVVALLAAALIAVRRD